MKTNYANKELPPNYKLQYEVRTSLHNDNDDERLIHKFDHRWISEMSNIIHSANSGHIEWRLVMEPLPFNKSDLHEFDLVDDDYFSLFISIYTKFIRKSTKRSVYHGVLGAILVCFLFCAWLQLCTHVDC